MVFWLKNIFGISFHKRFEYAIILLSGADEYEKVKTDKVKRIRGSSI